MPAPPSAEPTSSPTAFPATPPTPVPPGVPAGFAALSVTFVSPSMGFVLGTSTCSAADGCLALLRTSDSGHTWTAVQPPPTHVSRTTPGGVRKVRFADARNGWAFDSDLWATHDGGAHWTQLALLGSASNVDVQSLEVSSGVVHALVVSGDHGVEIFDSPAGGDAWTASSTSIPLGAGPVPQAQLTLQRSAGWAIEVDRTVIGGARLGAGRWTSWQPPCGSAGGPAWLAAATTTSLAAVCDEGEWNGPSISVHLYLSSDGGSTFRRVAAPLSLTAAAGIAMSTSGALVVGGGNTGGTEAVLQASFDGGASWSTVYRGSDSIDPGELGFTTATQGVAISGSRLLITFDGGHHWSPVSFG
jgi:hypothetical protein